ncbi:MAG: hypothetical protein EOP04_32980, partial [Proteobacteria bacterium]
MTKKFVFICDESGAKGYSNQKESYAGEVGVFAGILIREEWEERVRAAFKSIYDKYKPSQGKLHIAELESDQQEALREEIFGTLKVLKLPCFWYAIHVEGFNGWYTFQSGQLMQARADAAALHKQPPRIKRGSPRDKPESLHETLFEGLYSHVLAYVMEQGNTKVEIEVQTDQIDAPIIKNFNVLAKNLLNTDPELTTSKGYDTVTEKTVTGSVSVHIYIPPELQIDLVIEKLSIATVGSEDELVLAADVLANSLNYMFKNRTGSELYAPLNCLEAVASHPLYAELNAFREWVEGDIGDALYR